MFTDLFWGVTSSSLGILFENFLFQRWFSFELEKIVFLVEWLVGKVAHLFGLQVDSKKTLIRGSTFSFEETLLKL